MSGLRQSDMRGGESSLRLRAVTVPGEGGLHRDMKYYIGGAGPGGSRVAQNVGTAQRDRWGLPCPMSC
jgi:hypothetical protein